MRYDKSLKYDAPELRAKIMGPNPVKLLEELLQDANVPSGATVVDLGSGLGLTSVFLAEEYGLRVFAADLWSDPEENRRFFASRGLTDAQIVAVKADATALPFDKEFFDAVVSSDSYNYFGRDPTYLDEKLLPLVKPGGYLYLVVPGLNDSVDPAAYPPELLLSWTPEQLAYLRGVEYWREIVSQSSAEVVSVREMESRDEVWRDWIACDNDYAVNDRKSIAAGALRYLNFVAIVLRKPAVPTLCASPLSFSGCGGVR